MVAAGTGLSLKLRLTNYQIVNSRFLAGVFRLEGSPAVQDTSEGVKCSVGPGDVVFRGSSSRVHQESAAVAQLAERSFRKA